MGERTPPGQEKPNCSAKGAAEPRTRKGTKGSSPDEEATAMGAPAAQNSDLSALGGTFANLRFA